jgi:hypothetical protein
VAPSLSDAARPAAGTAPGRRSLHTALAKENADVTLIVLWDGKAEGDGPGVTADMVALAVKRGVKIARRLRLGPSSDGRAQAIVQERTCDRRLLF